MGDADMARKHACLVIAAMILVLGAAHCRAMEPTLGSRKFQHLTLAVGEIPSDCRGFATQGAALSYVRDYLNAHMGPYVDFVNTNNAPVLMITFDCLRLVDASDRGDSRTIGYAVNMLFQFTRPFYEDITYIYAAPWSKARLLFIPYREFSQDYFDELMDETLDEFAALWINDHPAAVNLKKK